MKLFQNPIKINKFTYTVAVYALILAILVGILKYLEYRYLVRQLSLEISVISILKNNAVAA